MSNSQTSFYNERAKVGEDEQEQVTYYNPRNSRYILNEEKFAYVISEEGERILQVEE